MLQDTSKKILNFFKMASDPSEIILKKFKVTSKGSEMVLNFFKMTSDPWKMTLKKFKMTSKGSEVTLNFFKMIFLRKIAIYLCVSKKVHTLQALINQITF